MLNKKNQMTFFHTVRIFSKMLRMEYGTGRYTLERLENRADKKSGPGSARNTAGAESG